MDKNNQQQQELKKQEEQINSALSKIKYPIVVFSGKGGVGKTNVAVNLSYSFLKNDKNRVGLLDADITGPNVAKMTGLESPPNYNESKNEILAEKKNGLSIMSIAPLIPAESPIIWRGPLRSGTIRQFLAEVKWGELDYLLADLPPGTGDEVLTASQSMKPVLAIIVTTPQDVSLMDCKRAVNMAKKLGIPKIGVVENMSELICPHCETGIDVFGTGGGEKMAEEMNIEFLGSIPMEIANRRAGDEGTPIVLNKPESETTKAFADIAKNIESILEEK